MYFVGGGTVSSSLSAHIGHAHGLTVTRVCGVTVTRSKAFLINKGGLRALICTHQTENLFHIRFGPRHRASTWSNKHSTYIHTPLSRLGVLFLTHSHSTNTMTQKQIKCLKKN